MFQTEVVIERQKQILPILTSQPPKQDVFGLLTFLALQRHPGLQVVHLKLQALERTVGVSRLALVRDEHGDDGDEKHASARPDPDDGGQREGAVGINVKCSWRILQTSHQNLHADKRHH